MGDFQTEQEGFWAGEFGNEYVERNAGELLRAANLNFFSNILARTGKVKSVIELGANLGLNLLAMESLVPGIEMAAIEINGKAVKELKKIKGLNVYHQSILEYVPVESYDLVFTKGVLIHLNPECLPKVYDLLYKASNRYVCVAEYYNPSPVEIAYRGHRGKLFKRDFAGELMDKYPDLTLIDYGFSYHRDQVFPQDDITWFLMEKQ